MPEINFDFLTSIAECANTTRPNRQQLRLAPNLDAYRASQQPSDQVAAAVLYLSYIDPVYEAVAHAQAVGRLRTLLDTASHDAIALGIAKALKTICTW